MDFSLLGQFALVSFLFVITPGADWAYIIAAGINHSSYRPAVWGLVTGYAAITVALTVGLGTLLQMYPQVLTAISLIGGIYLVYLGISAMRARATKFSVGKIAPVSTFRQYVSGLAVCALNPKAYLLMLAVLPQFMSTGASFSYPVQLLVLGLYYTLITALVYSLVGAGSQRLLKARPTASLIVTRFSGIIMFILGLGVLWDVLQG